MKAKGTSNLITILDNLTPETWRQPKTFYASQLRECGRRQVLALLGNPEKKVSKPEWTRAARMGDMIHDYVTSLCQQHGILEAAEKPLRELAPDVALLDEYMVSGRVDGVLVRNGNRRLLEVKSMADSKFRTFYPGGSEKFEDALYQSSFYLWALKLEGGFILAVNRDNLQWKEFTILYDDAYIMALLARIKRLKNHFENGTLPEPERSKCTFCGYRRTKQCPDESEVEWL